MRGAAGKIFVFISFCLSLSVGQIFADDVIHILKSGETIYSLARDYGVKIEEILFLNGIEDARRVQVGQRIRIPDVSTMAVPINLDPSAPPVKQHRAAKGETLFGIARQYNVSIQNLRKINRFSNNYVLKAGDIVKIPVGASSVQMTAEAPGAGAVKNINSASGNTVNLALNWPIRVKEAAYMTGKLSGVSLLGDKGESIYSIFPGTVVSAGPYRGFGRVAIVKSEEGYLYVYGGCESLLVKAGDFVPSGTELGRLGIDAVSGRPELFFMVYLNNKAIDPSLAPRA
jgi:LysM repeat protein